MPTLRRYAPSNPKYPGWFIHVSIAGEVKTAQVPERGKDFLDACNYQDNETIESALFWALFRRELTYFPDGTGPSYEGDKAEDWAELREECLRRARHVPLEKLIQLLDLTPAEIEAIRTARGETEPEWIPFDPLKKPQRVDSLRFSALGEHFIGDAATMVPLLLSQLHAVRPEWANLWSIKNPKRPSGGQ